LTAQFANRVQSVGLFCGATYAAEAEQLVFGPSFTETIRQPGSWQSSLALRDAAAFTGRALLIIGAQDTVIPWEVTTAWLTALRTRSKTVRLDVLGDADHRLALWLGDHPDFGRGVVDYLVTP
jgi:pimeloyl-ACP methyl ester carboxylesterase